MWAYWLTAPRTFERLDVPAPTAHDLGDEQVLLRTLAVGICGSDVPPYLGRYNAAIGDAGANAAQLVGYPAHEIVGEVVSSRAADLAEGELVVGWASRFAALAEYVVNDARDVLPYGELDLTPELAVALQPLACVLNAVDRLPDLTGRSVAVLGQGPIGAMFNHVLRERGADRVVGIDPIQRIFPPSLDVDAAFRVTSDRWAAMLADADRPAVVIEAVGHQSATLSNALRAVADEGTVYLFGVNDEQIYPISIQDLLRRSLTLISGTTRRPRQALAGAIAHARAHPALLSQYVTTVVPMTDANKAFEMALSPGPDQFKIVLSTRPAGS